MSKTNRVLSLMLVMLLMLSLFPASAFAADNQDTYSIVISYQFADGTQAAPEWTAKVAAGSAIDRTVSSPTVVGYEPDRASVTLRQSSVSANIRETVTYHPALVTYTVKHYQQNVTGDRYTLVETEPRTGYTGSLIASDLKKAYEGFTALNYDTDVRIAADGSTVVELYYDRIYYLLGLDLDGGFGAEPVYARYGTPIQVSDPTKPGYSFLGWSPALPETMPAGGGTYTAQWSVGQADYLVQYWLEDAEDTDYNYDSSVKRSAATGSTVSGTGDKSYTGFHFDHADQNVTVNGDGSSVVNVYYKRNTYTLTFNVDEGIIFSNWVTKAEFKNVKYGEDTTKYWAQAPSGYRWCTDTNQSTAYTYAPAMPNGNLTVYGESVSNKYKYTIHYYEEGTTNRVKDDNTYYRSSNTYNLTDEDYIYIPGFICLNSGSTDANRNLEYFVYYRRKSYTLDFNNNGTIVKAETVPYEAALSPYNFTPDHPAGLETGAHRFEGWFLDPGCTDAVNWATATMPHENTILYAKWSPVTHTVTFAKTEGSAAEHTESVAHGALVPKYEVSNDPYTFVGWFYRDENGEEHAFDLSMPVVRDMDLYAKWRTDVLTNYIIHYRLGSEDGTPVADDLTGSALALTTKTFQAKTGEDLYAEYRNGYFPTTSSHSILMNAAGGNEFTFVYVAREKVSYTVRYLEKGTNAVLHEEKKVTTSDAIITEKFVPVEHYAADAYQKQLVLSANEEENVLIFWYVKDEVHAPVQIIHWIQNVEGSGYTEYQSSSQQGVIGETYTAAWQNIEGFHSNEAKSNVTGKLTSDGLILNLYYDRDLVNYTFYFKDELTGSSIADPVTGTARYGAQVIENAKTIDGYRLKAGTENPKALILGTEKNEFTFYYVGYFNVVHVQGKPVSRPDEVIITQPIRENGYELTDQVTSGYLYGGTFADAACQTVYPFSQGENGLSFAPEAGKTYYIWEVDQKYLAPKTFCIWLTNENREREVVGLYLMAPLDRLLYREAGFILDGADMPSKRDGNNVAYGDITVTYTRRPDRTDLLYLSNGVLQQDTYYTGATKQPKDAGYIAVYRLTDTQFSAFRSGSFTFQPYWVTLDGVKVTGVNERTCTYQTNSEHVGVANSAVGSRCTPAGVSTLLMPVSTYSIVADPVVTPSQTTEPTETATESTAPTIPTAPTEPIASTEPTEPPALPEPTEATEPAAVSDEDPTAVPPEETEGSEDTGLGI